MPFTQDGCWYPKMFQKQLDVYNSRKRALLVSGPRISGKTRGVHHRIVRHLWETDGARIGMFVRTMKTSKDGGGWSLINKVILKEWFQAGIGMRYTTMNNGVYGPKTDGITRTPYFSVRNAHGTESTMMLFSIDDDSSVEDKLKELEFSMIYFSELDKFGDRKVLTVALPSLRMGHLRYEDQMWIADCNPSEEGESSWIYEVFYKERTMGYDDYCAYQKLKDRPVLPLEDYQAFYSQLGVIEILPADNIYVDPRQLQEVKVACGSDEGLYARHIMGKWVWGGGDASRHFRQVFSERRHVVGDVSAPNEDDWLYANPSANSWQLLSGWDLGDTNHAAVLADKTYVNGKSCYTVLDELVSIGREVSNSEFAYNFMELVEAHEKNMQKTFDLERSWSDLNSLEKYSAAADTYPYLQIESATEGRVVLRGVGRQAKARGSVRQRVALIKQLLREDRLKVSAHCLKVIQMFKDLKKGETDFVVQNEDKHVFDALSYMLFMETYEEMDGTNQGGISEGKRSHIATTIG